MVCGYVICLYFVVFLFYFIDITIDCKKNRNYLLCIWNTKKNKSLHELVSRTWLDTPINPIVMRMNLHNLTMRESAVQLNRCCFFSLSLHFAIDRLNENKQSVWCVMAIKIDASMSSSIASKQCASIKNRWNEKRKRRKRNMNCHNITSSSTWEALWVEYIRPFRDRI